MTLVERTGLGGAAVLTDCVPSKTLIATANVMSVVENAEELGISFASGNRSPAANLRVDLAHVNRRVMDLADRQSADIADKMKAADVQVINGSGRLVGPSTVRVDSDQGKHDLVADIVLLATGTAPRELPTARYDGERILNWKQVYELDELPQRLIVVGSGVTGAEFASAYHALGAEVVLVSSRKQVLPGEDPDAASVLQDVFERKGMSVMSESRAESVRRRGDEVIVTLTDGREVRGSHCLMAVGSVPNTADLGLSEAGVAISESGHIIVDRVSRTSARGVYAAGDCTGVLPLASVAAMQGRIAIWHALGDAVAPLDLKNVSANVFTSPEIATVGVSAVQVANGELAAVGVMLPLTSNARAKMAGLHDGFVKLFCLPVTGIVVGGVVVAPYASELIHPISLAVAERLTVDNLSHDFTVYPSLSGSIAEAARQLHLRGDIERSDPGHQTRPGNESPPQKG